MLKAKNIIEMMENWAPTELAEEWDNVGFQIGEYDKEINKILIALDIDHRVVKKAVEENFDMIITHHPFIFQGIKKINNLNYDGKIIIDLIKNNIVIYNAHTNLDQAIGGVNEELSNLFDLENSKTIVNSEENTQKGYGKVGNIGKIKLEDYLEKIKTILDVKKITVFGDVEKEINKVALIGGSGGGFIEEVAETGADLFITGDIKYHDAQKAEKLDLILIDAGHYHTEKIILPVIKERLKELNKDLEVEVYEKPSPLYGIY